MSDQTIGDNYCHVLQFFKVILISKTFLETWPLSLNIQIKNVLLKIIMPFLFLFIMSFSFSRKFLLPFKRKQKKMLLYKDWIHSMSHILYSAAFKYQKLHDLVAYIYGNHGSEDEALLGHRSQTLGSGVLVDVWSCGKALKALGRPRRS